MYHKIKEMVKDLSFEELELEKVNLEKRKDKKDGKILRERISKKCPVIVDDKCLICGLGLEECPERGKFKSIKTFFVVNQQDK